MTWQALDTGSPLPSAADGDKRGRLPLATAQTLLALLSALQEPVVPHDQQDACARCSSKEEAFQVRTAARPFFRREARADQSPPDPRHPVKRLGQRLDLSLVLPALPSGGARPPLGSQGQAWCAFAFPLWPTELMPSLSQPSSSRASCCGLQSLAPALGRRAGLR